MKQCLDCLIWTKKPWHLNLSSFILQNIAMSSFYLQLAILHNVIGKFLANSWKKSRSIFDLSQNNVFSTFKSNFNVSSKKWKMIYWTSSFMSFLTRDAITATNPGYKLFKGLFLYDFFFSIYWTPIEFKY